MDPPANTRSLAGAAEHQFRTAAWQQYWQAAQGRSPPSRRNTGTERHKQSMKNTRFKDETVGAQNSITLVNFTLAMT